MRLLLQELVLRDNKLTKIPDVSLFKKLLNFDVSFNEITSLFGLSKVTNTLKELYVSKNEVPKIEEIDHFRDLQILELGSNRLRVRHLFPKFTWCQILYSYFTLWMCWSFVSHEVVFFCSQVMENLQNLLNLQELWLGRNRIKVVDLCGLKCIKKISLQSNRLTSMKGFQVCVYWYSLTILY